MSPVSKMGVASWIFNLNSVIALLAGLIFVFCNYETDQAAVSRIIAQQNHSDLGGDVSQYLDEPTFVRERDTQQDVAAKVMQDMDHDRDSKLSLDEFGKMLETVDVQHRGDHEQIRQAFLETDKNFDGVVGLDELKFLLGEAENH
eukprot:TRINITY_DN63993_c0_g1_i1.p1 TRINITY_DN63993_c0_g1~~TRINITY_DN63993_c0_g1_i1.p1  ORF type:complete len:157 (+),score=30.83 TRINITY_DN63993_c0_g1_i1:38-472(+)